MTDTIEWYAHWLQAHDPPAWSNTWSPTTSKTGPDGFRWRGQDGLAEFLDVRSVFFDESHEVLQ